MSVHEELEAAADDFLDAAFIGQGWERALERLAIASGARAAILQRAQYERMVANIWTPELTEAAADYLAGRVPPNPRQTRVLHPVSAGFRVDQDDFSSEEMATDPYYQEFVRPRGFFWHANARLCGDAAEHVTIGFKRSERLGPYQHEDVRLLNSILPRLRTAVRVARSVLNAEARGMARLLHQRDQPVFEFDSWGRVLRVHGGEEASSSGDYDAKPVAVHRQRLIASDRHSQDTLDRALAAAITPPQRSALARLFSRDGGVHHVQFVPIRGVARDVFHASVAVAVLIGSRRPQSVGTPGSVMLREAFELTGREAMLAALLRDGLALPEIAGKMGVEIGTARNHLKSVLQKTGTARQAELVALLSRFDAGA